MPKSAHIDPYKTQAELMRRRLNRVSPSFCLAKWLHVSLNLSVGHTQSCYHPPSHKVPTQELRKNPSALHNTKYKKLQRKAMLQGIRPAECEYCWKIEDLPRYDKKPPLSDRHYRSAEAWAAPHLQTIATRPWNKDITPSYVEVCFSNICQLKCAYCSPSSSSSWFNEIKAKGPYPTRHGHNRLTWFKAQDKLPIAPQQPNPYLKAFWKWWPKLYPELRYFRMTGGEPLLDSNTKKVFDYAFTHPNPELTLSITSNFCAASRVITKFNQNAAELVATKKIRDFQLFASIDCAGPRAEYIRDGLDYILFFKNIESYLQTHPELNVTFIITMNNLCLGSLQTVLKKILQLRKKYSKDKPRVMFDTPILTAPGFFSLQILGKKERTRLAQILRWMKTQRSKAGFTDNEISLMERVERWSNEILDPEQLLEERTDFLRFFRAYDARRGLSFLKTFPELKQFWKLCEQENRRYFFQKTIF